MTYLKFFYTNLYKAETDFDEPICKQILDFCIPGFVFKDPALTSADRDSACCIRDRAIAGLCRCIWNMICRLCIGPQHTVY